VICVFPAEIHASYHWRQIIVTKAISSITALMLQKKINVTDGDGQLGMSEPASWVMHSVN